MAKMPRLFDPTRINSFLISAHDTVRFHCVLYRLMNQIGASFSRARRARLGREGRIGEKMRQVKGGEGVGC
jgi:hypothetical protein